MLFMYYNINTSRFSQARGREAIKHIHIPPLACVRANRRFVAMEKKVIDRVECHQNSFIIHFTDGSKMSFHYEGKDDKSVYKRYAVVRFNGKILWSGKD